MMQSNDITSTHDYPALCELLPYRELMNGMIVFSDREASLGCGWEIVGKDIECLDPRDINDFTLSLRNFLNNLPDGLHSQFIYDVDSNYEDHLTVYGSGLTSQNEIERDITETRISAFRGEQNEGVLFRPRIYLFIRYTPPSPTIKKFKLFESSKTYAQKTEKEHDRVLQEVADIADNIFSSLTGCGLEARRLNEDDYIRIIYQFLNPARSRKLSPPKLQALYRTQELGISDLKNHPELSFPSAREQLVFSDLVHNESTIYLDEHYYKVITLKTTPEFTQSCMIRNLLVGLPFHFYYSLNIEIPDQHVEFASLQRKRKMTHAMTVSQGLKATDLESESKLSDTEDLIRELINTGSKIFYIGATLILRSRDRDELQKMTRITLSKIRELNSAEGMEEREAALPLFLASLPFCASALVRSRRMKTANVADFLPLLEPNRGSQEPACLFKNREGGLFKFDPFDSQIPNYSSLITGISGSGKSFLANYLLLSHLKEEKNWLAIIDIGNSYKKLVSVFGGDYLEVRLSQEFAINPMELPKGETKPSNRKIKSLMAFLEIVFSDEQKSISKLERNLLEKALFDTYDNIKGRNPKLSDLKRILEQSNEKSLQNFSKMLFSWTENRPYGILLDRDSTLSFDQNIVAFDLNGLSTYRDLQSALILILTDAILDKIENASGKKLVVIDEGWSLIRGSASTFIEYVARAGRKKNTGLVFITQGLSEIIESSISSALLGNTANKFILRQSADLNQVKQTLKLNDRETEIIGSLEQKRGDYSEVFLLNYDKRAVLRVSPTPLEYWIATTHPADLEILTQYQKENRDKPLFTCFKELSSKYPKGALSLHNR